MWLISWDSWPMWFYSAAFSVAELVHSAYVCYARTLQPILYFTQSLALGLAHCQLYHQQQAAQQIAWI